MKFLSAFMGQRLPTSKSEDRKPAPPEAYLEGSSPFPLTEHLSLHERLPILDWGATLEWSLKARTDDAIPRAIVECQRGWLLHLRDALGGAYELHESNHAFVLSAHGERKARGMLEFIERTRRRILSSLEGLAELHEQDHQILIVFADQDTYYRYVSHAYPENGEFAFSSGMFLHAGCPHFVTAQADIHTIERVIAHEMTHASVSDLRIPLWVNEGLAVNVENRLMGKDPPLFTPAEMRHKHLEFWSESTIQEFWSGKSFSRPDDGSMLSYDLAQVLVEIFAGGWTQFRAFAQEATYEDAGEAAAHTHLGLDLGASIAAMFDRTRSDGWGPDPEKWHGRIEHTPE
jgi:hypothetical protein